MMWMLLRRELRLLWLDRGRALLPAAFFVMAAFCFGLGAEPNSPILGRFSAAIVWVCAALALILGADRIYSDDFRDGIVEQIRIAGVPLSWYCLAKLLADWLAIGLPVALGGALITLMFGVAPAAGGVTLAALALGTVIFTALSGFLSALGLGLHRPGVLQPILMLPLAVPTVIFGAGAMRSAMLGLPAAGPLYFLGALALLCLCLLPLGTAAALRNAMDA